MAKLSYYKFVNPGSVRDKNIESITIDAKKYGLRKGQGGGDDVTNAVTAGNRKTVLGINRLGLVSNSSLEQAKELDEQVVKLNTNISGRNKTIGKEFKAEEKKKKKLENAIKRQTTLRRGAEAERKSENRGGGDTDEKPKKVAERVGKGSKGLLGFFGGFLGSILKPLLTLGIINWLSKKENAEKAAKFLEFLGHIAKFFAKVIEFGVIQTLEGLAKIFDSDASLIDKIKGFFQLGIGFFTLLGTWALLTGKVGLIIKGLKLAMTTIKALPAAMSLAAKAAVMIRNFAAATGKWASKNPLKALAVTGVTAVGIGAAIGAMTPEEEELLANSEDGVLAGQDPPELPVQENKTEQSKPEQPKEEKKGFFNFSGGGLVPGTGFGDIVPAKLTPGEFVFSKPAVDNIGLGNLSKMNALGGGTNRPTLGGGYSGGGFVGKPKEFAKGGIAKGPDSGYPAILHGTEAVIPLENRFTKAGGDIFQNIKQFFGFGGGEEKQEKSIPENQTLRGAIGRKSVTRGSVNPDSKWNPDMGDTSVRGLLNTLITGIRYQAELFANVMGVELADPSTGSEDENDDGGGGGSSTPSSSSSSSSGSDGTDAADVNPAPEPPKPLTEDEFHNARVESDIDDKYNEEIGRAETYEQYLKEWKEKNPTPEVKPEPAPAQNLNRKELTQAVVDNLDNMSLQEMQAYQDPSMSANKAVGINTWRSIVETAVGKGLKGEERSLFITRSLLRTMWQQQNGMPKLARGGSIRNVVNGSGLIQGPMSGYPVYMNGGMTPSFIGHGTEFVSTKSSGGFVIPMNTPSTKSDGGLFGRRVKEATAKGYNHPFKGFADGGFISREKKGSVRTGFSQAKSLKDSDKKPMPQFADGGSLPAGAHRRIPDTPETSWAAGIPLTRVASSSCQSAEVALPLAKRFKGFITDLESTGYKITEMGGFRPDGPPKGNKDGKGPKYAHPYGAAIDINWTANPAFTKDPAKKWGDFPSNSGALAGKYGLGWGGHFDDAMHFSAMKSEYGDGIDGKEISRDSIMNASGDDYEPPPPASPSPSSNTGGSSDSSTTTTPDGKTTKKKKTNVFAALADALNAYKSAAGISAGGGTAASDILASDKLPLSGFDVDLKSKALEKNMFEPENQSQIVNFNEAKDLPPIMNMQDNPIITGGNYDPNMWNNYEGTFNFSYGIGDDAELTKIK